MAICSAKSAITSKLACGLLWIVDPAMQTVTVHRSPVDLRALTTADTLSGEDVMPGFFVSSSRAVCLMNSASSGGSRELFYQIYPRSFMDSNGDGVGDLPGITSNSIIYSGWAVDAIWISPIFPSPMADFGYDVSDYTDIQPAVRHPG